MLNIVKEIIAFLEVHFNDVFVYVVAMASAIIMAIGLLKPILFNKIKNKQVRKFALAFTNVALCFASALVIFIVKDWNLKYYLISATALTISCILTYWLYENTCLRNLIATIGNIVLRKAVNMAVVTVNADDINEIKTEITKATNELRAQTKEVLKEATTDTKDKDLKGL